MSNLIDLKLHTVILLVGPTNSGKSFFSKMVLMPALRSQLNSKTTKANVQYLGSDDLRREVLGDVNAHKYDGRMMAASDKAFKLLHTRLELAMEWPNQAHFVIVDTTGLAEDFRKKVIKQAKEANYNIAVMAFDYKKTDEYLRHVPQQDQDKKLLFKHIKRFREEFWPSVNKKDYDQVFRIKSKDFDDNEITVRNLDLFRACHIDSEKTYDVVSDVHGCLPELQALLVRRGHKIDENGLIQLLPNTGLVFVGDLIDKGPDSAGVLKFLYAQIWNQDIHFVMGNHENFCHKYLTGQLKETGLTDEFRGRYFDCTDKFHPLGEETQYLKAIVAIMTPFIQNDRMIVTHAPCENRYLGKFDNLSIKRQSRTLSMPRPTEDETIDQTIAKTETQLGFLQKEAVRNHPFHIFGHVAFKDVLLMKNKLGIDTGCVHGGRMTLASIGRGKPYFMGVSIGHQSLYPENLFNIWKKAGDDIQIDLNQLEGREYGRVMWLARDKISFISGTIAPVEADQATENLESFEKALDYYRKAGVSEVVIQPKYMGSRCNIYLSKNIEECLAVSRNGFKIKQVDMAPVYKKLLATERFRGMLLDNKMVVLDGELMPWHALGAGLIEEQYKVVENGLETEFAHLAANDFVSALRNALVSRDMSGFQQDRNAMDKKALGEKHGHAKSSTFRALDNADIGSLDDHVLALSIYKEQIKIFGSPGELEFKPFGILKTVRHDDTEENWMSPGQDTAQAFQFVSEDHAVIVQLDHEGSCRLGADFFNDICYKHKMEGVVVKPRYVTELLAPALKVRSPAYLTLIYGYDYTFQAKYQRLIQSKRTGRKMRTSTQEAILGRRMLDVKQIDINEQNNEFLQLVAKMVLEERTERELDPRL